MKTKPTKPLSSFNLETDNGRYLARKAGHDVPKRRRQAGAQFWSRVNKADGCWEWMGNINQGGYGRFTISNNKAVTAHRYAWALSYGPVPEGLVVCHRCDNRRCVRPSHLFTGTQNDNVQDCKAKGRMRGNSTIRGWRRIATEEQISRVKTLVDEGRHSLRSIARLVGLNYMAVRSIKGGG